MFKFSKCQGSYIVPFLENFSVVYHEGDDGKKIHTQKEFWLEGFKSEVKAKYSMYYLYQLVHFVAKVFIYLDKKSGYYPYISEYFNLLFNGDKKWILSKKKWS